MVEITSTSNPRVKLARRLQQRRHRQREGLCLLEGVRLVRDAWFAGASVQTLFVTSKLVEDEMLVPLYVDVEQGGGSVLQVSDEVMAVVSDTVTPQGLVALVSIPPAAPPPDAGLVLVLDGISDPGNGGTLLRSAAAAGVDLVVAGPGTVDLYNAKVLRAAMGAHFRLPVMAAGDWEAVAATLPAAARMYVAEMDAAVPYDQVDWRQPAVLAVGNETDGPGQWVRERAEPIRIPMLNDVESLNAGVAGSAILLEAARQRRSL